MYFFIHPLGRTWVGIKCARDAIFVPTEVSQDEAHACGTVQNCQYLEGYANQNQTMWLAWACIE